MGVMLILGFLGVISFTSGVILVIMSEGRGKRIGTYLLIITFFILVICIMVYSSYRTDLQ
jgi:hypothetical protein